MQEKYESEKVVQEQMCTVYWIEYCMNLKLLYA